MTQAPFKPLNPWGQGMPRTTRAMPSEREGRAPEADLWQIWVETRAGHTVAVGPKMTKAMLEPMLVAINGHIALGNEKRWSNPHLLRAETGQVVAP